VPATLEWRSSNTTVATVDSEGRVVGHAQGSATIIARASAHNIEGRHEVAVFVR
jgi:uncharacterized protein YjdB